MDEPRRARGERAPRGASAVRHVWSVVGIIVLVALTPCAIVSWNIGACVQDAAEQRERYSQHATPEQIAAAE